MEGAGTRKKENRWIRDWLKLSLFFSLIKVMGSYKHIVLPLLQYESLIISCFSFMNKISDLIVFFVSLLSGFSWVKTRSPWILTITIYL